MAKLWTFGDSFTEGHGCLVGYDYYENYPDRRGDLWTDLVGDYLNMEVCNLGYGGNSNPYIISQVLENLPHFNKEDVIVIEQTIPERSVIGNLNKNEMTWIASEAVGQNERTEWIMENFGSVDAYESFQNYVLDILLPQGHIYDVWYEKQFRGLCKFLIQQDFQVYFWSYNDWGNFQTIAECTGGEDPDLHWSWNGHSFFSKYLINRIESKILLPEGRPL